MRGGSILNSAHYMRAATRNHNEPEDFYWAQGMRCAR